MPALKNSSLVVLDNASHHKVKTEDTMCRYISKKKTVLQTNLTKPNISEGGIVFSHETFDLHPY
jgi:hypothetical protein